MNRDALSPEADITNATMFEVGVKSRTLQCAREGILLADPGKFDTVEPHRVATLSCIKRTITDSGLANAVMQRYQQGGIQIIGAKGKRS